MSVNMLTIESKMVDGCQHYQMLYLKHDNTICIMSTNYMYLVSGINL
nr:MAG TPA: hypothetical protein [Myoviridae sp. ctNqw6]